MSKETEATLENQVGETTTNTTNPGGDVESYTTTGFVETSEIPGEETELFDKDYVTKLRNEAAKHRAEKKAALDALEAQKKAAELEKMDELEKAQKLLADKTKELEDAQTLARRNDLKAQLAPRVVDANAALLVAEQSAFYEDGQLNLDGFLEAHPYFVSNAPKASPVGSANAARGSSKKLTREALETMSPEEFKSLDPATLRQLYQS